MDPATFKTLFDALAGLGAMGTPVAVIFAWLYLQERAERKEKDKEFSEKLLAVTVDGIKAETEMTTALNLLAAKVSK